MGKQIGVLQSPGWEGFGGLALKPGFASDWTPVSFCPSRKQHCLWCFMAIKWAEVPKLLRALLTSLPHPFLVFRHLKKKKKWPSNGPIYMFNHKWVELSGTSLLEFSWTHHEEADSKCSSWRFNALSPELPRAVGGGPPELGLKAPAERIGQEEVSVSRADHAMKFWEVSSVWVRAYVSMIAKLPLQNFTLRSWSCQPSLSPIPCRSSWMSRPFPN